MHSSFVSAPDQATLANWRAAPFNRWAFHHVREIIPSVDIKNDPATALAFPSAPIDLGKLRIEEGDERLSLTDFLQRTSTDGLVIVSRGRVVFEYYANGMSAQTPHILMSVSKSLLGLLAGELVSRRVLQPEHLVTDLIPELAATAYEGATILQLLDMRVGISFDEDYLAVSGPVVAYRKATNWNPVEPGDSSSDLHSFYRELTQKSGQHGGPFNYVSPNSDLLGWVIERVSGRSYADLMSDLIWKPMGATRDAYITVDRLGAPRCAGGVCATLRDLARVGQLVAQNGIRDGIGVIPSDWIEDIARNGDAAAWAAGVFREYFPGKTMRYRSNWYVQCGAHPILFGLGIHGQGLFVDRARQIVIAKVSSQAQPLDPACITLTMDAISRIIEYLIETNAIAQEAEETIIGVP